MSNEYTSLLKLHNDTLEKELAKARKVVEAARAHLEYETCDCSRDRCQRCNAQYDLKAALAEYDNPPKAGEAAE
jgi:hypothetical protein